jgi:hypothetical protein
MKKIHKYDLNLGHNEMTKLHLPANSLLLHIDKQNGFEIYAWFEVIDTEELDDTREFVCMHTGSLFDASNLEFRKTVVFQEQRYVVHIYEKKKFLEKDDFNVD